DDVCGAGCRAGGAAGRRAGARVRHRRVGRPRSERAADVHQPGVRGARRDAARGRRLSERAGIQCDRRPAAARRAERTRPELERATSGGLRPARACVPARDGSPRRRAVRRSAARPQTGPHRPQNPEAHARRAMVSLRIVFFGTPEFAVPSLDALLGSRHQVVAAVTQPDRPRGRGQKTSEGAVKLRALGAGIPVLQPERLKEPRFLEALSALRSDLGVVAAYGRILTDAVLAAPRLGMINVHASLLPQYRGAAPVHRAIMAGERETGVTIMRVVKELDAGPMLAKVTRQIGADETSDVVERDLAKQGAALLASVVDSVAQHRADETPQDHASATYANRLTKGDGLIDWTVPAPAVHNRIRGLHPWPHAYTFRGGNRYILLRSAVAPGSGITNPPGTILEAAGDR